jgi:hypothetical protein
MKSQTKLIKDHLQAGHSITPLQALRLYGCLRLGARIYDLKRDGLDIDSHLVRQNGKQFSEYSLKQSSK